jgi:hypothetical protein
MTIDRKHLVSGVLLAFVAVTAGTLAVKETRRARAVAAAEAVQTAGPQPAPPAVSEPNAASAASGTPGSHEAVTAARPPVSPKATGGAIPAAKATAPTAVGARPETEPATIYVTYFHTTARCVSCLKIEDLTNATMSASFAGPIAEKRVVWRVVNVDVPENNHYVKDYSLYTKSVVVSEVKNGREIRWKNLEQVWQLLRDPEAFRGYVEREVRAFLEST